MKHSRGCSPSSPVCCRATALKLAGWHHRPRSAMPRKLAGGGASSLHFHPSPSTLRLGFCSAAPPRARGMPRCRRAVGRLAALLLLACVCQVAGQTDASEGAVAPAAGASGGVGSLTATEAELLSLVAGGSGAAAQGPEVAQPAVTVLSSPTAVTAAPVAVTTPVAAAATGAPTGFVWRGAAAAAAMPNAPPSWMLQCVFPGPFLLWTAPPHPRLTPTPSHHHPRVFARPGSGRPTRPRRRRSRHTRPTRRAGPATGVCPPRPRPSAPHL